MHSSEDEPDKEPGEEDGEPGVRDRDIERVDVNRYSGWQLSCRVGGAFRGDSGSRREGEGVEVGLVFVGGGGKEVLESLDERDHVA